MAAGERTEAATPRRLQELRRQGRVVRSVDLTTAAALLAAVLLFQQLGGQAIGQLLAYLRDRLADLARPDVLETNGAELAWGVALVLLGVLGPLLVVLPLIGTVATIGQVGLSLSGRGAAPDFERVSPLAGLRRLFSLRSLVELAKTLLKVALLAYVVSRVYVESLPDLLALATVEPRAALPRLGELAIRVGLTAGAALLALAGLDYGYQRWEFFRQARMTREELREELRQTEGSPQVRARIRQLQRKLAASRMLHAVPKATVVVTNPTHLAIALAYDESMPAPRVVAKGAGLIAARIKEIAHAHRVPVVENQPLAQALFRTVEIGMAIPAELFQAVAEVLAYIYSLRQRRARLALGLADGPEAVEGQPDEAGLTEAEDG